MFRRTKRTGYADVELLSVYRDYGVIPKASRDDNFNKPSEDLSAYQLVQPRDLVTNKMKTWQGSIAISDHEGIVSPAYHVYAPLHSQVDRYIHHLLRSPAYVAGYIQMSKGIRVNQWDLEPEAFSRMQVLLPPPDEQCAIADFLDRETSKIDALVAKKERLIELLQEKRTALITDAVTKGLDPNAPMKPSGIEWFGDIPEHWKITRLGWVSEEINDINHEMPQAADAGVLFLSAKDLLDDGTLNFTQEVKRISEEDFIRLSVKVCPRKNDIIYSRIGACLGKARLVETDQRFLISYSCCVVRVNRRFARPRFFRHLLDAELVLTEAKMRTQGIGVPDLGLGEIRRFPVPLPPKAEQDRIADCLDTKVGQLRALVRSVEEGLERLLEYRTALISAAVTGKIDVREEVA